MSYEKVGGTYVYIYNANSSFRKFERRLVNQNIIKKCYKENILDGSTSYIMT